MAAHLSLSGFLFLQCAPVVVVVVVVASRPLMALIKVEEFPAAQPSPEAVISKLAAMPLSLSRYPCTLEIAAMCVFLPLSLSLLLSCGT